jgi:hypothetical protein
MFRHIFNYTHIPVHIPIYVCTYTDIFIDTQYCAIMYSNMTADEVLEFRIPRVTTLLGGASHLVSGDQPIPQYPLASAGRGWPTLAEHDVKSLALMAHDL